jgi:hypothetical protein
VAQKGKDQELHAACDMPSDITFTIVATYLEQTARYLLSAEQKRWKGFARLVRPMYA